MLSSRSSSNSSSSSPSHLFNVQGPLQVGGISSTVSFLQLADSYGWTLTPPSIFFSGCVLELRHKDHLYDLNATDFNKSTIQPCDVSRSSRVVLGRHSIIILASFLSLLLLVVVILCLARRDRKSLSYPDLDREVVKETMGGTDLEGFGEKDVTHFDLKILQVTPDGHLVGDENERPLPDVVQDVYLRDTNPPLSHMPEGRNIGDFIKNIVKMNQQHQELEEVRHYSVEGDEMSAASLSSLTSGSSWSVVVFNCRTDWSQKFEKLAQIYRGETEGDDDSEDESFSIPSKPSRSPAFLPHEAISKVSKNEARHSPPSPALFSPVSSVTTDRRSSYVSNSHPEPPHVPVLVTKNIASGCTTSVPQSMLNNNAKTPSYPSSEKVDASLLSSSPKLNHQNVDPPSVSCSEAVQAPSSSLFNKQQLNSQTSTASKHKLGAVVTTINNLYTSPAQHSARTPDTSPVRARETLNKPVVNGHLISNPNSGQCSAKTTPQLSSSTTKTCDNQKAATAGKSVKVVKTWC